MQSDNTSSDFPTSRCDACGSVSRADWSHSCRGFLTLSDGTRKYNDMLVKRWDAEVKHDH